MIKDIVESDALAQPIAEYSQGVRCGPYVLIGAKGATARGGTVLGGTTIRQAAVAQVEITLSNVVHALAALGASINDVVQATAFVTDSRLRDAIEAELRPRLPPNSVRTFVYSPAFALPELLFEVDVIALDGGTQRRTTIGPGDVGASFADGWLFSDGLSVADRRGSSLRDQLRALGELVDGALAQHGMTRENLVRLRAYVPDGRHVGSLTEWVRGWDGPGPTAVINVGAPPYPMTPIALDFIACADIPARISAADLGTSDCPVDTIACSARGLTFTSGLASSSRQVSAAEISETLAAALGKAGLGVDDVGKVDGVIDDWMKYADFKESYRTVLAPPYPTRSLTQGGGWRSECDLQLAWTAFGDLGDTMSVLVPAPG